ncbi:MAG: hypothetical protein KDK41_01690 [Leptospiraceae bacterium]|nr:hypothetical protein [Leptospiraceae bacterium]MCB1199330.1 hypothetical protein [Leptospiraceae bacterium]
MKHEVLSGEKIMMVQPVDQKQKPMGSMFLALDKVQCGVGDLVLVVDEGNSARLILDNAKAPQRAIILAIVDNVDLYS